MTTHPLITSRQNPRIKRAAALRERRAREEQQRIILHGPREIGRALAAGVEVVELFVCESLLEQESRALVSRAERSAEILPITATVYAKLSFGDRQDGLVAVTRRPQLELAAWQPPEDALVAVLEGVEKPGNLGAVVRSADAAGVAAVICADGGTDLFNPHAIRASAGTIFALPVLATTNEEVWQWLHEQQFRIVAARVDAERDYTAVDLTGRTAVVLGSEAQGLTDFWRGEQVTAVRLPMCGRGDSLNVSVTAAVLFYEALRQRCIRASERTTGR